MPKITRVLGSGMTRSAEVRFDPEEPEDIHGLMAAAAHTVDRSSFQLLSRRIAEVARHSLDESGLPSDPERLYLVSQDGRWTAPDPKALVDEKTEYLPLNVAVQACGHHADSSEGYAAAVLMVLAKARQHLNAGTIDDAMALAFEAGELVREASMKEMFDPDFLVGDSVREGGRKGQVAAHGTEEEKDARRAEYVAAFDAACAVGKGRMQAYEEAAERFGVDARTVQRAVQRRDKQG